MTVALPIPYDDEHLYSVIARYMQSVSVDEQGNASRALFRGAVPHRGDFLCGLSRLARETRAAWLRSDIDIAETLTLLPYFTSFTRRTTKDLAYAATLHGGHPVPYAVLGLLSTNVKSTKYLRFCSDCVREDLISEREPYWRRVHQLPGVFVCLKHRAVLQISNVPFTRWISNAACWRTVRSLGTQATGSQSRRESDWLENGNIVDVSNASVALLTQSPADAGCRTREYYLSRAVQAGFESHRKRYIDTASLCTAIAEMFGAEYLEACGLSVSCSGGSEPWPIRMIRLDKRTQSFQPLQHVLIEHFFDNLPRPSCRLRSSEPSNSRPAFTCPNRFAQHGSGHLIERVKVKRDQEGTFSAWAACACGLQFTFRRFNPDTAEPEVERIAAYGNDMREHARGLERDGMRRKEIAQHMGVSLSVIHMLMSRRKPVKYAASKITKALILEYRREWRQILDRMPVPLHTSARRLNRRIWETLHLYDHEWIMQSKRRCWDARTEVERRETDRRSLPKLVQAFERVLATPRPVRVTRAAIVREADLGTHVPCNMERVPDCWAFLQQFPEPTEHFKVRCLETAALQLASMGSSFDEKQLIDRAKLNSQYFTVGIRVVIKRLLDGAHLCESPAKYAKSEWDIRRLRSPRRRC